MTGTGQSGKNSRAKGAGKKAAAGTRPVKRVPASSPPDAVSRENEARFRMLFQHAPAVAVQGYNMEGTTIYWNDASERIYGYTAREAIGKNLVDLIIPPEMRDEVRKAIALMAETGRTIPAAELTLMRKDGSRVPVYSSHAVVTVPGSPPEMFCIDVDLTGRKLAEEALRTSELRYKAIVDSQAEFVVRYHPGGILTFVNDTLCKYTNRKHEDLLGRSYYPFMHPDDRDAFIRKIEALDRENPVMVAEARVVLPDGRESWHQWTHHAIFDGRGKLIEYQCTGRDITEQKRAAEALRRSEEKYRDLFENAIDAICIMDRDQNYLDVNRRAVELFGYSRQEFLSMNVRDMLPPEQLARSEKEFAKLTEAGAYEKFTGKVRKKDGSYMDIEVSSSAIVEQGRVVGSRDIIRDITERGKAEEARRQSEEKFRLLVETSYDWVWEVDSRGVYTYASPRVRDLLGYAPDEVVGKTPFDLMPRDERERVTDRFREIVKRREPLVGLENTNLHKDGRRVVLETSGLPIFNDAGEFKGYRGIDRDITYRKRAEESLRESEGRIRSIIDSTPVGMHMYRLEPGGRLVFTGANPAADRLLGVDNRIFVGKTIEEAFPPLAETEVPRRYREVVDTGMTWQTESIEYREDAIVGSFEVHAFRTGPDSMVAAFEEISQRKQAEARIKESEKKFRNLFESATDGIFILDLDGNFIDVNPAAHTRLGYTKEEMLALHISKLDPPEYAARVPERLSLIRETGMAIFESAHLRKDGSAMPVEVNSRLLDYDGRQVYFSVIRDITERKQAEEALRKSEKMLQTIFDAEPECVKLLDENANLIMMNKAGLAMLDVDSLDQVKGQCVCPLVTSEYRQKFLDLTKRVFQGESGTLTFEMVGMKGRHLWMDTHAVPLRNEKDEIVAFLGVTRDVTEQKRAESALRENQARLDLALQAAHMGVWRLEVTENKRYFDDLTCQLLGIDGAAFTGTAEEFFRVVHPADRDRVRNALSRTLEHDAPYEPEYRVVWPDGTIRSVAARGRLVRDDQGSPVRINGVLWDITEKRLFEEERLKAQKLESLGTLAGGIAHDFNNLLQGIFGYISMAKMTIDQREKSLSMLEQAEKALHQSVNLTSQLLTFSKGGKPVKKVTDLRTVIENAVKFALSGSRVSYDLSFGDDLSAIDADEGQIGQVVQNIVLNAEQAMPLGGTIEIAVRNVPPSQAAGLSLAAPDGLVEIVIRDQGTGIPPEHLPRIFDPYFTTKEKGSGLGLASSYSIVKNHDGMIDVSSVLGKGSTFTVYLPASGQKAAADPGPASSSCLRACRILLMDDEEIVRQVAYELLTGLGHSVDLAVHGKEAVEKYQQAMAAGSPFDIVILDLTIRGGMGGVEAMKRLREIDPGVKAIVSSGYSDDTVVANYRDHGFAAFLKKPYDMAGLQATLNELLA